MLEVHEVRRCDVRGRCGALGLNFSVSLHTRCGAVLIGCSVCHLCPRLLHHDLKTCRRDAKRVLKQTNTHFKTFPRNRQFPFVPLNFTFPIFPLKEANNHILFVFHPSAGPERMKKQQKRKTEWEPKPRSRLSREAQENTLAHKQNLFKWNGYIYSHCSQKNHSRWLFNGKQGRGVGRITNLKNQNFSANVRIQGVELTPRSWARTQINKPENIPMYFQSISNNTLYFNDAYSGSQKDFLFFQSFPSNRPALRYTKKLLFSRSVHVVLR